MDLGNLGISQLSLDKRNLSLASEKDLKTCANIDTKFQQVMLSQSTLHLHPKTQSRYLQVQKKWSGGSLKSPDRDLELDQLYKVWNLLLHLVVLCHFDQMIVWLGEVCSFARS